jgi:transcriptional regulator with XRE-family HTH domain
VTVALLSDSQRFAQLLRTHRDRARLTQEELAERARMSVRALRDLERGRTRYPHRTSVRRLAVALELTDEDRDTFERTSPRSFGPTTPPPAAWEPPAVSGSIVLNRVPLLREVEEIVSAATGTGHPAVLTISGPPGVGKTTFAVQCAHVLRARLGIEVLFLDLGRDTSGAVELRTAVREAHLRRVLSGSRCLLVVDGADAAERVLPLLNLGFTGVIVVGREPLAGLPVTLDIPLSSPR